MHVRVKVHVHTQSSRSGYSPPLRMCSVPMYTHRNTDMCIWICTYVHVYLCMHVWIYMCTRRVLRVGILHSWGCVMCLCICQKYGHLYSNMYVCTRMFMYVRVCIHMHMQGSWSRCFALLRMCCMPIHMCTEISICIFIYVRTCIYIHKCTYKHIRAHTGILE